MKATAEQLHTQPAAQATACAEITWHLLSTPPQPGELPDAEINVLLAYGDAEVIEGWADGMDDQGRPIWRDYSAWPMKNVYAWADMPPAPEVLPDAAPKPAQAAPQGRAQLQQQLADLRGQRGAMAALMRELLQVVQTIGEPESDDEAQLLLGLETKTAAMLAEIDQQAANAMVRA